MKVSHSRFVTLSLLVLTIVLAAVTAQAASFSNASLKGSYGVLINRWTANPGDAAVGMLGVLTCDGAGNASLAYTVMSGGTLGTGTATGTYSLNSNGTGTVTFPTGFTNTVEFSVVVNSSAAGLAKGMTLLRIDSNEPADAIDSGTAVQQNSGTVTYGLGSVKGTFSAQILKWTAEATASSDASVAVASFDGAGNVKATSTQRYNGTVSTKTFTGTYTMTSNGSGTITFTGSPYPLAFVINTVTSTVPAKGAQLLQTVEDAGTNQAHTGIALKQ